MNATLLMRSPLAAAPSAGRAIPPRRERPAARSAWLVAFAVSAVLHLLIFAIIRFERVAPGTAAAPATHLVTVRPAVGTRVEQIAIVADNAITVAPATVVPAPRVRSTPLPADFPVVRDAPAAQPGGVPAGIAGATTGASTFEERLRPDERSPAVWLRPSPIHGALDPKAAAHTRLAGRIDAYNDSVALAVARAARAVDWTRTDENGGRWGVSPEGIHLGDFTIPIPVNFSPGPGKRDEVAGRVRDWGEIQAQGARAEGQQTFDERVKAIRERKERERKEKPPPI